MNRLVAIGGNNASVPLDTDATMAANSDEAVPSQKAVKALVAAQLAGASVDTDATFAADSDILVPSQKAVKAAFDALTGKEIEAANAAVVTPGHSTLISTTGTTVLDLTAMGDGDEALLISLAAVTMSLDFGLGSTVTAAGVAGTGARYVKFTGVVGTSCRIVRLSEGNYYMTSYVGAVTIAAAP